MISNWETLNNMFALGEIPVEKWELKWQNIIHDQMHFLPLLYFLDQIIDYRKVDLMVVQLPKLLCVFLQCGTYLRSFGIFKYSSYKRPSGSNASFSRARSALRGHGRRR